MAPDDSRWLQMAPDGTRLFQMAPGGLRWLQATPDGSQVTPDDPRCYKCIHTYIYIYMSVVLVSFSSNLWVEMIMVVIAM